MKIAFLISLCSLAFLAHGSAATVSLNISSGYFFDASGTAVEDRLFVTTLCVLVADLDGNGFDPVSADGSWAGGGDMLIEVSDSEYPGTTLGFDLTAATVGDPGFLSRTLVIDLAQFGSRTMPVPIALRWFPTLNAATTDLVASSPNFGRPYGEFSRAVPIYQGTSAWIVNLAGGATIDLDPLATREFGGTDSRESGAASLTVVPEPSSLLAALFGLTLLLGRRRVIR